jgi:penicillin amidase
VADYQDVYEESLDDVVDGHEETIAVRGADAVTVEVLATEHGPLFEVDRQRGCGLALRDAPTVLGDLGFDSLLPLLRARTVDDVDQALDHWVAPVNNVVIADTTGSVRFRNAGQVPVRDPANRRGIVSGRGADTWTGWVDLPRYDVPADGQVVTANERRGAESDALGDEFAPPHRADRIHELLDGRYRLTVDDFAAIHGDSAAGAAEPLRALLHDLTPGGEGEAVRQAILGWDGVMAAGSSGAAAFAAWRTALTRRICAEPVLAPLLDDGQHGLLFAPYLSLTASVGLALEPLVQTSTPFGIDVRRHATDALDDAAGHPPTWGDTHVLAATHAFDLADDDLDPPVLPVTAVGGDIDTVRCTGWLPGITDEAYRGSVARYVWDLADRSASGWVVPLGAAGDPRSPHHHDQLTAWAETRLVPVELDWDRLTPEGEIPPGRG